MTQTNESQEYPGRFSPEVIEYEIDDRLQQLASNIIELNAVQASHMPIYLSVVFGFIAAAYVAGAKLTRFQAGITYVVFTLFSVVEISRIVSYGLGVNEQVKQGIEWGSGFNGQYIDPIVRIIAGTGLWVPLVRCCSCGASGTPRPVEIAPNSGHWSIVS